MIYQSEHVLHVFTYSEMVRFWSSVCFQSSATYHLFICPSYLLTLVLLKFSSYSHTTFWRTFFCLFDSSFAEWKLHISATYGGPLFLFCIPMVCLHECLAIYFHLTFAYWAALCGPSLSLLWISSQILYPLIQAGGEGADLSLLSTFLCWGSGRKVEGFKVFVLTLLLYLLIC